MKTNLSLASLFFFVAAPILLAADAKTNWEERCAKCHGATGVGDTKMGKKLKLRDLTQASVQKEITDQAAFKAIKEGLKGKDGATQMQPVEGLTDDEIRALVQHFRTLKK